MCRHQRMSAGKNFSKQLTSYVSYKVFKKVLQNKFIYPVYMIFFMQNNGHGPCQDVCINKQGGYECSCEGLPGNNKYKLSFI